MCFLGYPHSYLSPAEQQACLVFYGVAAQWAIAARQLLALSS